MGKTKLSPKLSPKLKSQTHQNADESSLDSLGKDICRKRVQIHKETPTTNSSSQQKSQKLANLKRQKIITSEQSIDSDEEMVSLDITETKLDITDTKTHSLEYFSPKNEPVPQVQHAIIEPKIEKKKKRKRIKKIKETSLNEQMADSSKKTTGENQAVENVDMEVDDQRQETSERESKVPEQDTVDLKDDFELRQGGKRSSYTEGANFKELTQNELQQTQVSKVSPNNPLVIGQTFLNKYIKSTPSKSENDSEDEKTLSSAKYQTTQSQKLPTDLDGNSTQTQVTMTKEGGVKKTKFTVKQCGKFYLHHMSHLNDPTLQPRKLEATENLFEIIMPWVPEEKQENERLHKEKVNLGLIIEPNRKKIDIKNQKKNKQTLLFKQKRNDDDEEEEKIEINLVTPEKSEADDEKPKTEAQLYSKTVKVGRVEQFNWEYDSEIFNPSTGKMEVVSQQIKNIEAIYINPKWKQSKVGDYLTFNKNKKGKKMEIPLTPLMSSKFDSQIDNYDFKINPNSKIRNKEEDQAMQSEDSSDEEKAKFRARARAEAGLSIEEFMKLEIPNSVMKDGMIFIWVEKEYMYNIVQHLEKMNFFYVENVCYIALNREMQKEVRNFATIDATPAFCTDEFSYLRKSHRSLLMFRRTSTDGGRLELRHQRTGDVVFDWRNESKPTQKPDFYLYRLIEILLPRAMADKKTQPKVAKDWRKNLPHLKMVELWAQNDKPRKGWLKIRGLDS